MHICVDFRLFFCFFSCSGRSEFNYFNDPKSYPFSLWIPFIIEDYWAFFAFFALQCVSGFLITSIFLGIDTFMFGAIYAIAGQIDLLNSAINKIENSTTAGEYDTYYNIEIKKVFFKEK